MFTRAREDGLNRSTPLALGLMTRSIGGTEVGRQPIARSVDGMRVRSERFPTKTRTVLRGGARCRGLGVTLGLWGGAIGCPGDCEARGAASSAVNFSLSVCNQR